MKKLFTLLAIATSFAVMAPATSEARDNHDHRHGQGGRNFWHNCSVCGGPMYRERVMVGRDRHGHPIFNYRAVPHQHVFGRGRGHDHHGPSRGPGIFIPLPGRR